MTGKTYNIIKYPTDILADILQILQKYIRRKKLKEGIVRDTERQKVQQEMKKTMNTYNLQQQKELERTLRREENKNFAIDT